MDVVGGVHLADGAELKAVSGIDDNSRFVVSASWCRGPPRGRCVRRCWRRCGATGCPEQILTDNGKVFTGRFGPAGPARRCCSTGSAPRTGSGIC